GDLHRGAEIEAADGREVRVQHVPAPAEEIDAAELHRQPGQREDADQDEDADREIERGAPHGRPPAWAAARPGPSTSPRMNCCTMGFAEAWTAAAGPDSMMTPSWSMATWSAMVKISGISWLTITAVKRSLPWRSWIRWWI